MSSDRARSPAESRQVCPFPRAVEGHCATPVRDCALHSANGAGAGAPSTRAGGRPEPQCGRVPGQSRWPPGPVTSWSHPWVTCTFRPSPSSTCKQQATRDVGDASPVSPLAPVMSWLHSPLGPAQHEASAVAPWPLLRRSRRTSHAKQRKASIYQGTRQTQSYSKDTDSLVYMFT